MVHWLHRRGQQTFACKSQECRLAGLVYLYLENTLEIASWFLFWFYCQEYSVCINLNYQYPILSWLLDICLAHYSHNLEEQSTVQNLLTSGNEDCHECCNGTIISKGILNFCFCLFQYDKLSKLVKDFEPFRNLWITTSDWLRWHESWMNDPLTSIDAETVEKNVSDSYKTMHKSVKIFADIPGNLKERVLPVIA